MNKDSGRSRADTTETIDVDRRLRQSLTPDSESVERIVRLSLAADWQPKAKRRLTLALAGAALGILMVALAILLPQGRSPEPSAASNGGRQTVDTLTITNLSGEIEVLYPEKQQVDRGAESVCKIQNRKALTIFNANGIVAAFAPASATGHFIIGGEL